MSSKIAQSQFHSFYSVWLTADILLWLFVSIDSLLGNRQQPLEPCRNISGYKSNYSRYCPSDTYSQSNRTLSAEKFLQVLDQPLFPICKYIFSFCGDGIESDCSEDEETEAIDEHR